MPRRLFLLSPARCDGKRAQVVLRDAATFPLARQLRSAGGAPLGDVFSFLSGLYFRGKLAYARRFASAPAGTGGNGTDTGDTGTGTRINTGDTRIGTTGVWVITTNRGLVAPETPVTVDDLRRFGCTAIHEADNAYRAPLLRDARAIAKTLRDGDEVVLLGSVATGKYVDVLLDAFGDRLRFPADFAGRGDMSRGGLMLRRVASGEELAYVPLTGLASRHGKRPPKLTPIAPNGMNAKTPRTPR